MLLLGVAEGGEGGFDAEATFAAAALGGGLFGGGEGEEAEGGGEGEAVAEEEGGREEREGFDSEVEEGHFWWGEGVRTGKRGERGFSRVFS